MGYISYTHFIAQNLTDKTYACQLTISSQC